MNKIFLTVLVLALLCSCKDQYDVYSDFEISNGISYPGKVASPSFNPGFKKGEISFSLNSDPSVKEVRVYWDNYTDSIVIPVTKQSSGVKYVISPLDEGSYSFSIRTVDGHGHMSVPAEVIGQVYGDNFLKTLFNRLPKTALLNPDDHVLTVEWAGQASHEVKCIVEYVNISDATVQEEIPIEEMNTVIEGYKSGLKVRSFFHPKDAIDTLEITPSSPKVTQPALYRIIESGLRTDGEVTRITVVQHDDYIEMRPTANDPYMYTLGLPEAVNLELYYRVYFIVEYQISREVTEGQLFYGRPGAAGGVSTDMDLVYPSLGLDPDDESKWLTFRFDCSQAINTYSWGAVGHRFRFDYVQDVSSENAIMYVRSMKYEIYTLQEID